ncbi:SpoIIE family protein phosphatase [Treponema sp. HNW]|uniref:PP2C family protein-serine/threonine phosphatase n=1 Tax=Treponema sp. HNW TaxID=3116654 RepID=UPI003D102DFA
MIFFILNLMCAAALFGLSFVIDFRSSDGKNKAFINMLLLQALWAVISALCVLFVLINQWGLSATSLRFFIWLPAVQSILMLSWCALYPDFRNNLFVRILKIAAIAFSFYTVFFLFDSVYFDTDGRLTVLSKLIGSSSLDRFGLYKILLIYVFPGLSVLVLFFKYELLSKRLIRRHILLCIAAIAAGAVLFTLIISASRIPSQPFFLFLLPYVYGFVLFLFYLIGRIQSLFSLNSFFRTAAGFGLTYIIPAALSAVVFSLFRVFVGMDSPVFFLIVGVSTAALFLFTYALQRYLFDMGRQAEEFYADRLEADFAALNFGDIDMQIDVRFAQILQNNIHTLNVVILTDNNAGKLTTRYSLKGDKSEFDLDDPVFSSLLNMQRRIVFKTHCDTVHELSPISSKLNAMFEQTDSSVMILLNEGARLFALILLGARKTEQPYTDYDYEIFNKLYSRFFLTGYYLKNIANEELIALVGREIRFSSQVIQSLHKKTDMPVYPGFDASAVSLSSRSLGSGFTDFIRLDAHRYIGVIGDLSGKGLNASMLMSILKSMIPVFLAETRDFKELIQKVNAFIRENMPRGTYFAGMFCLIDMKSRMLYYANCALAALFMYNKTYNNMIEIQGDGKILGFVPDISSLIKIKKIQLSSGDVLAAVTGGCIETKSLRGERFGKNRIQTVLLQNLKQPAAKICETLDGVLRDFAEKDAEEDVSISILKVL